MPLIRNKRMALARFLQGAGLTRLLECWGRPGLLVLTYHRIGEPGALPFYDPVVSATPQALRAQLEALARAFRIATLADVAEFLASGGKSSTRGPLALVTFDDGTLDHREAALPVLRALGIPAVFFVSTGLIDEPRLPWYDHVAYVLKTTTRSILELERPAPLTLDLSAGLDAAIAKLVRVCLDHDIDVNDEAAFRAHLDERAAVAVDPGALGRRLYLTWDDIRALREQGMEIGSHAHSHRMLARLDDESLFDELSRSHRLLGERIGHAPTAIAYPYGWSGTFDDRTRRLAREAGYALGFTSLEGFNPRGRIDPFAIRRLGVGSSDTPTLLRARLAIRAATGRGIV